MNPALLRASSSSSLPAFLYHGTTARAVGKILVQGLRPRGRRKGNYAKPLSSEGRNVYLTTVYGPAYACRVRPSWRERLAVLEIDTTHLDTTFLRPDEDYMTQSVIPIHLASADAAYGLAVHAEMRSRLDDFQEMWRVSLADLGTVAYQGAISPAAITRVAEFDPKEVPEMVVAMSEVSLNILGHLTRGPQIAAWTRWLFDGPSAVQVSDFDLMMKAIEGKDDGEVPAGLREFARRQEEELRPILDRWNAEVSMPSR
ncbi:MAG: hypothetical protein ACRYFS_25185 [Janthinobacterium lividum]